MIIGIDARFYGPLGKGLGRYSQKLIENLEKIDKENEYVIFLRRENWSEFHPRNPHFKKVLGDYPWYTFSEQLLLPWKIWREGIELMHFPHFNVPIFCFKPFVVTIHDLIITKFPTERATTLGPILYKIKRLGYRVVIWLAVKRARQIITVSNFSKEELIRHFRIPPQKIRVTYEATDLPSSKANHLSEIEGCAGTIKRPYLLYVGNAYPHKNLEGLLKAFKILLEKYHLNLQLVLVGKEDYFYKRLAKEARAFFKAQSSPVIFTGFLQDADLAILYSQATLYVFPSFYEGFGLPSLEAMAWGLPVVASRASSLPEVLGEAAIYFDPKDPREIARVINQVLQDQRLLKELRERSLKHLKKFSWSKCASETLKIYLDVVK